MKDVLSEDLPQTHLRVVLLPLDLYSISALVMPLADEIVLTVTDVPPATRTSA